MLGVDSGTGTARYVIDGNPDLKYISSGYSGNTVTVLTASFSAATVLSHILILNHNLDEFYVYYDNTTTNCLYFACSNAAANTYISFSSVTVSSIQLVMAKTMSGSEEKKVGELALCERKLSLDALPAIANFRHKLDREQVLYEMPGGGRSAYNIRENYNATLQYAFISGSFKTSLDSIFEEGNPFFFVVAPTDTAWDGRAYEVDWVGANNFKPSTNTEAAGFDGDINLRQTSRAR